MKDAPGSSDVSANFASWTEQVILSAHQVLPLADTHTVRLLSASMLANVCRTSDM